MRYVFVSDIHGRLDKLLLALESVNFDMEKDTLVSLGDPFDRGNQNVEVLRFLMNCPHRIIVWGNHDLRLYNLTSGTEHFAWYDKENGTAATLKDFAGFSAISCTNNRRESIPFINQDIKVLWDKYCKEAVFGFEFSDLIAVHAWVPHVTLNKYAMNVLPDWRDADWDAWEEATWAHVENLIMCEAYPDKRMIIGHWHAWRLGIKFGLEDRLFLPEKAIHTYINADIFELNNQLIAIDGCSNYEYGGKVNAWVYETNEDPTFFAPKQSICG